MACSIRRIMRVLFSLNSLTIQCELLILQGIDINSPHYWSKHFGMFKKISHSLPGLTSKHIRFSKQTNHFLICVLQPAWRKPVNAALLNEKLITPFTGPCPLQATQ